MFGAELVDEFGEFDVVTAVFGDFVEAAFAEPLDGLKTFAGLFETEGGVGDGIEGEPVFEGIGDDEEHIEGGDLGEVEDGVAVEDFVVEADDIETDDEIGALEFADEGIDVLLLVDLVTLTGGAVGHAHTHLQVPHMIPSADFIGGLLGFEIEVDDVLHHRGFRAKWGVGQDGNLVGEGVSPGKALGS